VNRTVCMRGMAAITLFGVLALGSCSKNSTGGDGEDDGNNPYMITDLSVSSTSDSSITLIWTATGDDADVGTAASYDLRCWHSWISGSNWDSAQQIVGEPHPSAAGQRDSMCIGGLLKDSSYYFSLRVSDEAGNFGGSNCVFGVSFTNCVVHFTDARLDSVVREILAKPTGDVMRGDLLTLSFLPANQADIAHLDGVEAWTTLRAAALAGNAITDLTPLSGLCRLEGLGLTDNGLVDISPLAGMSKLAILHLRTNSISDIAALAGLTSLHQLDITDNDISDLSPLVANSGLASGDTVWAGQNPISQQSLSVDVPALQARGVAVLGL
jgi:hypothetical protein